MTTTTTEPREFHSPGTISTWFKRLFSLTPTGEPAAMVLDERRVVIAEIAAVARAVASSPACRAIFPNGSKGTTTRRG